MMEYRLTLNDSDVKYLDDVTNNIRIPVSVFEEPVEVESKVIIHYNEDASNVNHEYIVLDVNDEFVNLKWLTKLSECLTEETLTEANPFKTLKNKIKQRKSDDSIMDRAAKKADKTAQKQHNKTTNLLARDLSEGSGWSFYLQLPNEEHIKKPLRYRDVADLYRKKLIGPWLRNAIVVDSQDRLVRCAGEDYYLDGIKYDSNTKVSDRYAVEWTKDDEETFKEIIKGISKDSALYKAVADEVKNDSEETNNKADNAAKNINNDIINKFKKIAPITGLTVVDKSGKVVDLETANLSPQEMSLMTLKINNKDVNFLAWLRKYGKTLTESTTKEQLEESLLLEEPVIKLSPEDMMNPDSVDFSKLRKDAEEKEAQEKAKQEKEAQESAFREKYAGVYNGLRDSIQVDSTIEVLSYLFNKLVPDSGKADTVAGELVRATMRIMYRDYNDGDKFFEGYGIETCGGSAQYLYDNGFDEIIDDILDDSYRLADNDDAYTRALENLAESVITAIASDESLIYTVNDTDSRDYSDDYIKEHQPRYEYELYGSDDVVILADKGIIDSWELVRYVEERLDYESVFEGYETERPWGHHDTSVTVSNLTRDGYDRLHDMFEHDSEGFWEDLVSEYEDELQDDDAYEEDEDDFDYDDSYEED